MKVCDEHCEPRDRKLRAHCDGLGQSGQERLSLGRMLSHGLRKSVA